MRIVKFKNLYQVVKDGIGSVFQSHVKADCERYIRDHANRFCMLEQKYYEVSKPLKYGRVVRL